VELTCLPRFRRVCCIFESILARCNLLTQGEKEELGGTVEALRAEIAKNDNLFKRTLEADRAKMKQELQARTSRIRSLGECTVSDYMCALRVLAVCPGDYLLRAVWSTTDSCGLFIACARVVFSVSSSLRFTFARLHVCVTEAEKQELLNETQGLMGQITESMKEVTTLQGRYDEVKHTRDTLQESVDVLKSHNNQLIDDLKTADRTQEELREFSDRQAAQHRESVERLEMLLRESKKSASQTVVEMSQNLKVRPVSGRILIAVHCAAFTSVVLVYKTAVLTR
jgi:predicted nuclease with TOPRIM domain